MSFSMAWIVLPLAAMAGALALFFLAAAVIAPFLG